jgi:uncharacterized membrane protein
MGEEKEGKQDKKAIFNPIIHGKLTFGQKASEKLTKWGGSWTFIFIFFIIIILWIGANIYGWLNQWDPYPFILLNLALSLLAAIQAPIILMSQNRQSEKDRMRAEYDYSVNRKAEREIREIKDLLTKLQKQRRR